MIEKMQPILPGELKPLYVPGMFDQNTTGCKTPSPSTLPTTNHF
jgi:hypothetical protein